MGGGRGQGEVKVGGGGGGREKEEEGTECFIVYSRPTYFFFLLLVLLLRLLLLLLLLFSSWFFYFAFSCTSSRCSERQRGRNREECMVYWINTHRHTQTHTNTSRRFEKEGDGRLGVVTDTQQRILFPQRTSKHRLCLPLPPKRVPENP